MTEASRVPPAGADPSIAAAKAGALASAEPGARVAITGFGPEVDEVQRGQLAAWGLFAGQAIEVRQQRPMTIVECDHVELAIERSVAAGIFVEPAR